jgi:mannose-6-phosphate isomerase-like protein (cupin superfamily)
MPSPARRNTLSTVLVVLAAFGLGTQANRLVTPALAATEDIKMMKINLIDLKADEISKPSPTTSRSRNLLTADGMTLGVQQGPTSKHYHADANEMQYVVSGSGSSWLGEQVVQLKAGDLLIIPKGTHHGGLTGDVRLMSFKTPPQKQGDSHQVR